MNKRRIKSAFNEWILLLVLLSLVSIGAGHGLTSFYPLAIATIIALFDYAFLLSINIDENKVEKEIRDSKK